MEMRGIVMEVNSSEVVVLTRDGQFLRVPSIPGVTIGQEIHVLSASSGDRDASSAVSPAVAPMVRHSGRARARRARPRPWQRVVAGGLVACAAVVLAAWAGLRGVAVTQAYAYVSLDVNQGVTLTVSKTLRVTAAQAANPSSHLLKDVSVKGMPLSQAISVIMKRAATLKLLPKSGNIVAATSPIKSGSDVHTVAQAVKTDVEQALNAEATTKVSHAKVYSVQVSPPVYRAATKAHVSPGEVAAYLSAEQHRVVTPTAHLKASDLQQFLNSASATDATKTPVVPSDKQLLEAIHAVKEVSNTAGPAKATETTSSKHPSGQALPPAANGSGKSGSGKAGQSKAKSKSGNGHSHPQKPGHTGQAASGHSQHGTTPPTKLSQKSGVTASQTSQTSQSVSGAVNGHGKPSRSAVGQGKGVGKQTTKGSAPGTKHGKSGTKPVNGKAKGHGKTKGHGISTGKSPGVESGGTPPSGPGGKSTHGSQSPGREKSVHTSHLKHGTKPSGATQTSAAAQTGATSQAPTSSQDHNSRGHSSQDNASQAQASKHVNKGGGNPNHPSGPEKGKNGIRQALSGLLNKVKNVFRGQSPGHGDKGNAAQQNHPSQNLIGNNSTPAGSSNVSSNTVANTEANSQGRQNGRAGHKPNGKHQDGSITENQTLGQNSATNTIQSVLGNIGQNSGQQDGQTGGDSASQNGTGNVSDNSSQNTSGTSQTSNQTSSQGDSNKGQGQDKKHGRGKGQGQGQSSNHSHGFNHGRGKRDS